jgi:hypothetical protein
MKSETLKALKGSIIKWTKILNRTGKDRGSENCPLCELVNSHCNRCIVYRNTKKWNCDYTPYSLWADHQAAKHRHNGFYYCRKGCKECKRLAKKEVDFLNNLLAQRGE